MLEKEIFSMNIACGRDASEALNLLPPPPIIKDEYKSTYRRNRKRSKNFQMEIETAKPVRKSDEK